MFYCVSLRNVYRLLANEQKRTLPLACEFAKKLLTILSERMIYFDALIRSSS